MAGLTAGAAYVDVVPNLSKFSSGLVSQMSGQKKAFVAGGALIGAALIGGLVSTLKAGLGEAMEHQKVIAALSATIKSTGNAANISVPHVEALATKIADLAGLDDEAILAAAGWTATFKNIKNEGPGANAIFDRTIETMVDLAAKMAIAKGSTINLSGANTMLSKALNDPVKGLLALGRAGVQFSDGQKKTIKSMVENGNILGAQKLILKEVESQVKGSAKAYGDTLPGQVGRAKEAWNNLRGDLAAGLIPTLTTLAEHLQRLIAFLSRHPTLVKALAVAVGLLGVAMIAASVAVTILTVAASPLALIIIGVIVGIVALGVALVVAYKKFQTFRNIVGVAINFVKNHWLLLLALIQGIGPLLAVVISKFGTIRAVGVAVFNAVKAAVGFVIEKVSSAIARVSDFISKVKNVTGGPFNAVKEAVEKIISKVGDAITKVGSFITKVSGVVAGPFNTVKDAISSIVGFLRDAVSLVGDLASAIRNLPGLPKMPDLNPFKIIGGGGGGGGGGHTLRGGSSLAKTTVNPLSRSAAVTSALRGVWDKYAKRHFPGQGMPSVVLGGTQGRDYGFVPWAGGPGNRTVHLSKVALDAAVGTTRQREWFRGMFLHELAHVFQSNKTIRRGRAFFEGGADIFATLADGLTRTTPEDGLFYPSFSKNIFDRLGASWGLKGQFLDSGGFLPPGLSLAYNGTGVPERVLSPKQSGPGVTVEQMNIRTAVDIDLVAAALYRKALATG